MRVTKHTMLMMRDFYCCLVIRLLLVNAVAEGGICLPCTEDFFSEFGNAGKISGYVKYGYFALFVPRSLRDQS